jgi:membrane-associated protease RseP (regulator of RpoE activity)
MNDLSDDLDIRRLSSLLLDLYSIDAVYRHDSRLSFSLTERYDSRRTLKMLNDRLRVAGYRYSLNAAPGSPLVLTVDPKPRLHIPPLNIILFLATILSIYFVPVFMASHFNLELTLSALKQGTGIQFAIALVSILLCHEMGHYIAGRRRGIVTTWPYFIPAPNMFGTFGAVIASKSPFWNRRDLLEVGAAGPIAGWVVALAWLIYGLPHSQLVAVPVGGQGELGDSIILSALVKVMLGNPPPGFDWGLSEAAFAGWAGLLVTALNMLPIGQMDGGHILYGLVRKNQRYFAWGVAIALFGLGFQSPVWWLIGALGILFRVEHPPTLNDAQAPSLTARIMGITALIILILSFAPIPLRM